MLDALEAALPAMIEDNPDPGGFWMAFAGQADKIENQAGEHGEVDAWLNPDPANLDTMFAIFDDKQHPYYELVQQAA